jgi:hypothetical protein
MPEITGHEKNLTPYQKYVQKYATKHKLSYEEAEKTKICQIVKEQYERKQKETAKWDISANQTNKEGE